MLRTLRSSRDWKMSILTLTPPPPPSFPPSLCPRVCDDAARAFGVMRGRARSSFRCTAKVGGVLLAWGWTEPARVAHCQYYPTVPRRDYSQSSAEHFVVQYTPSPLAHNKLRTYPYVALCCFSRPCCTIELHTVRPKWDVLFFPCSRRWVKQWW